MCSQRVTILSHIAVSSSLFVFVICGIKGRENESLMVNIASQPAVKEIRDDILFLVELSLDCWKSKCKEVGQRFLIGLLIVYMHM